MPRGTVGLVPVECRRIDVSHRFKFGLTISHGALENDGSIARPLGSPTLLIGAATYVTV